MQPDRYFLPGTRPGRKCSYSIRRILRRTLRGFFDKLKGYGRNAAAFVGLFCQPAFACGVIDDHAGLGIVGIDAEADAFAFVLHGPAFHQHAFGNQVIPVENGGGPVENMVFRFLHVVGHHVLKGQHALDIHVPGAGDQIFLVGVLAGELEANEVAAVIKIAAVHKLALFRHLDLACISCNHDLVSTVAVYVTCGDLTYVYHAVEQVILLIDEIDKADLEFPNDLLWELDQMEFYIPETKETIKAKQRPIVIITSNAEKELPDAFLRRCTV